MKTYELARVMNTVSKYVKANDMMEFFEIMEEIRWARAHPNRPNHDRRT